MKLPSNTSRTSARTLMFGLCIFAALFPCPAQDGISSSRPLAPLEPITGILHCAGQSDADFAEYARLMGSDLLPAVTMHYFGLKGWWSDAKTWAATVQSQLNAYPDTFLALQIGLSLTRDGNPAFHYEHEVANGSLDAELDQFIDALEILGRPAYIRVGYEFNGKDWNGYKPESYRAAFIRIAKKIRERNIEAALVWNASAGGDPNFMDYYPGDEYVDWWGINWFFTHDIDNNLTRDFLAQSLVHGKPVMIGESSPAELGGAKGKRRWNAWFSPYFSMIRSNPQIKMISYINTDWTAYPDFPQWKSWGDGRLQIDPVVSGLYKKELSSSRYLHGTGESLARRRWYQDSGADPLPPTGFSADSSVPGKLFWNAQPGAAAYIVEKNGLYLARTTVPSYLDSTLTAGSQAAYSVRAIDRSGRVSTPTDLLAQRQAASVDRVINGDFSRGIDNWHLLQFNGASGTAKAFSENGFTGIRIHPVKTTGTGWHLQFAQSLLLSPSMKYEVSFRIRSAKPTALEATVQQQGEPYNTYKSMKTEAIPEWKEHRFNFQAGSSPDTVRMSFFLGASGSAEIEISGVSVIERF